ncbi:MAG: hypothetical protein U0L84_06335, partial [Acutalibacteraceae bacterium]|nr:hypothetical protein [Acutalibacteraceae bacterium]
MVKIVFIVSFSLLAIWGLCELIFAIRLLVLTPKERLDTYLIFRLNNDNALLQLYFLYEKYKWCGTAYTTAIIGIIDDLSDETILLCENFARNKDIY